MNISKTIARHFRNLRAFTLIELLVVISIIAILASLALPSIASAIARGQITQTMSNYRQLYITTQTASMDAQAAGSTNVGFPGDIQGVPNWSNGIINNGYLSLATFNKLMQVKGVVENTRVFNVGSTNDPNTVFIACANLSANGVAPSPAYGVKGGAFVTLSGQAMPINGTNSIATSSLTNGVIWASE
jgi:prepilin-type N-terminal cleavage/methylation domain-containing protein